MENITCENMALDFVKQCSDVLDSLKSRFLSECKRHEEQAKNEVVRYGQKAKADIFQSLKDDPRMPRSVNYIERYNALMKTQDRKVFFDRLARTFDLADDIVAKADELHVKEALDDAAREMAQRMKRLDGIAIVSADDGNEASSPVAARRNSPEESERTRIVEQLEAAFEGALGPVEENDSARDFSQEASEWAKRNKKALEEASSAAIDAINEIRRKRAESIAGSAFSTPDLESFAAEVTCERVGDSEKIRELSREVRKSFATFKEVVQDNGLFAAFSSEGSYGACRGYSYNAWWDDDELYTEYTGDAQRSVREITLCVEEDEGGDAIERSIERMREANRRPYDGFLDDEYLPHIHAFWYGYVKLMEAANGMYSLDLAPFKRYCDSLIDKAGKTAGNLGECMSDRQLRVFSESVQKIGTEEAG